MSEREDSYSTDVEEFSESGGTGPSDSSRISSNDSDGNKELGVQPYLYELEDDGSPGRQQPDSDDGEHVAMQTWKYQLVGKQTQISG